MVSSIEFDLKFDPKNLLQTGRATLEDLLGTRGDPIGLQVSKLTILDVDFKAYLTPKASSSI